MWMIQIEEELLLNEDLADGMITAFNSIGNLVCIKTDTQVEHCCNPGSEKLTSQTETQPLLNLC